MKKKIIQWLIGLAISSYGFATICVGIYTVKSFIKMINATGIDSVGYFIVFIAFLLEFLLLSHNLSYGIKNGFINKLLK